MRLLLSRIAVAFVFCFVLCCIVAPAQEKPEQRHITVTGEAEINVVPDEVVFDLTISTLNKDLRAAKTQTDERLKGLIALTKRYGVAPEDVQTDYIKLEPRYRGNDETRLFVGYSVRKDLVFTLRDVTKAEGLLSDITEAGVTRINGIRFRTSQLRKYRDQARALAIKAAQEKAIALTAAIGQKIGRAYSIEEEVPNRGYASQNAMSNTIEFADGDTAASEGTLALGRIKINARVTVRFELE
ncbi:MAG: SIMPL domain-containing protein [Acidobacteria bacterium]|nr:SIMPL domain-containing protein [Acidobacteriota bacterium]